MPGISCRCMGESLLFHLFEVHRSHSAPQSPSLLEYSPHLRDMFAVEFLLASASRAAHAQRQRPQFPQSHYLPVAQRLRHNILHRYQHCHDVRTPHSPPVPYSVNQPFCVQHPSRANVGVIQSFLFRVSRVLPFCHRVVQVVVHNSLMFSGLTSMQRYRPVELCCSPLSVFGRK